VHLREARRQAKLLEATTAAEMRRGGWSMRRRGSRTPARSLGRHGARAQQQAARAGCSPPGAAPERLPDDETTATTSNRRRPQLWFASARVSEGGGSGEGVQGAAVALNSPGGSLGVRATHRGHAQLGLGDSGVRVGDDAEVGMTCGSRLSA
jgi:hypothetical protein